jgi:hypothetical protein
MGRIFWLLALLTSSVHADEVAEARKRWAESPHGPMLERILPPTFEARQLPERKSPGAQLTLRYCVQCHNLPNPAMHHAAKWPPIVERMVQRMEGRGNMGTLMSEMMAGVSAPSPEETRMLVAYLRRHAQRPWTRRATPRSIGPKARPSGWRATSAMCCRTRSATPRPSGAPWWRACRKTWSG